ncbi:Polyphosphate kinase 2 [compost metagenome]
MSLKDYPTHVKKDVSLDLPTLQSELSTMQDILAAQNEWTVLVILQGMDTAGKDGLIKHVMSGVNPQGCVVRSFKKPTHLELDHDFLWRTHLLMPQRGQIGIFNRSYYEDVIVPWVHPEILTNVQLPKELIKKKSILSDRCADIVNYERYLNRQGVKILKFFLHISKEEQKERLLARLDDPLKNWKFEEGDVVERGFWKKYQKAYEFLISKTSTTFAPWHIIPADNKEAGRLIVSEILVETLKDLKLNFPQVNAERRKELASIGRQLRKL